MLHDFKTVPIPKRDQLFDDYRETGGYMVHYKAVCVFALSLHFLIDILQCDLWWNVKGDLVLWDSRTVHCNAPSIEPTLNPKDGSPWVNEEEKAKRKWEAIRMVAYICS